MWFSTYGERAFGPFTSSEEANVYAAMLTRHANGLISDDAREFANVRVFHVEPWDNSPVKGVQNV